MHRPSLVCTGTQVYPNIGRPSVENIHAFISKSFPNKISTLYSGMDLLLTLTDSVCRSVYVDKTWTVFREAPRVPGRSVSTVIALGLAACREHGMHVQIRADRTDLCCLYFCLSRGLQPETGGRGAGDDRGLQRAGQRSGVQTDRGRECFRSRVVSLACGNERKCQKPLSRQYLSFEGVDTP